MSQLSIRTRKRYDVCSTIKNVMGEEKPSSLFHVVVRILCPLFHEVVAGVLPRELAIHCDNEIEQLGGQRSRQRRSVALECLLLLQPPVETVQVKDHGAKLGFKLRVVQRLPRRVAQQLG